MKGHEGAEGLELDAATGAIVPLGTFESDTLSVSNVAPSDPSPDGSPLQEPAKSTVCDRLLSGTTVSDGP